MALSDDDLLKICQDERRRSIGFENDEELTSDRIRALEYSKGEMNDIPALDNRSRAMSSDIADAIETVLPDLVDIFATGDDDFAFQAIDEDDEAQAALETDFVNQVIFQQNDGFMLLTTILKDALQLKTGVAGWVWEPGRDVVETFDDLPAQAATGKLAPIVTGKSSATVENVKDGKPGDDGQPTFSFTIKTPRPGRVKVYAYPPEDFTVASDTVLLRDTTYCAVRTRPRLQQLIADGLPKDKVLKLPPYGSRASEEGVEYARDTAGESNKGISASTDSLGNLRTCELIAHVIRVDADGDGEPELHRLLTGGDETVLLERTVIERVPFAACKPFLVAHRFIGQSLADKLFEVQRVKTALMRMMLDSGYFALNQRMEVAQSELTENTMDQLLDNSPGLPVETKSGNGLKPIVTAPLSFNPAEALEYWSVVAEQRTGVVRNAQGLNPDTLHDTASGQMALMTMAQKRVRQIARMLAESGLKDLFLGVHAELRKRVTTAQRVKIKGKWVDVNPSEWQERIDMTVDVGYGASGKDAAKADLVQVFPLIQSLLQLQGGGTDGPYITKANINAFLQMAAKAMTTRGADRLFSDPTDPANQPPPHQPQPPIELLKIQSTEQIAQAKGEMEHEHEGAKLLMQQAQMAAQQQQAQAALAEQQRRNDADIALRQVELEQERDLRVLELGIKYQTSIDTAQVKAAAEAGRALVDLHIHQSTVAHEAEQAREDRASASDE